jgi:hypothetical protein
MIYFMSWIILWTFKQDANRIVYRDRGREEFR